MNVKTLVKNILKTKETIPIQHVIEYNKILNGKVAIIVGGSGGIGLAIAKSFLESGCKIILCGTNKNKLENSLSEFNNCKNIKPMIFDMTDISSFKNSIEKAASIFGKIDILVNAAGVHTENVNFFSMTPEEFDRIININIRGVYFLCKEFAEYIKNNTECEGKKHILLISSSRGNEPAWTPYGISKWALNGLTQGLAQFLLPYGIVVNAIAPGSTATPLIGINKGDSIYSEENGNHRLIMPDEIANFAKLLVSPSGDMIVGDVVYISGGRGVFDIR